MVQIVFLEGLEMKEWVVTYLTFFVRIEGKENQYGIPHFMIVKAPSKKKAKKKAENILRKKEGSLFEILDVFIKSKSFPDFIL